MNVLELLLLRLLPANNFNRSKVKHPLSGQGSFTSMLICSPNLYLPRLLPCVKKLNQHILLRQKRIRLLCPLYNANTVSVKIFFYPKLIYLIYITEAVKVKVINRETSLILIHYC